jgi:putative spermidine/putrescine transport system permease protein
VAARDRIFGWVYVSPLLLVLVPFFVAPLLVVIAASFFESDGFGGLIANPTLGNYVDIFTSALTFNLYLETIKFTVLTWFFSLIIGFWIAYFLVFHVRSPLLGIGLFLLCTVPFWTSNIIRMISWIPLLGKEGLINMSLIKLGVVHEPLEFLLFSSFSVVVAYVHQLTIFMVVPIFNAMARIDKRVVEAALDAGACRFDIVRLIVLPLSKNGIALGSIFVVSIVMGDFFVIKVMSGGGSASVVGALYEDVGVLQYPSAAASAVLLTIVVTLLVTAILRTVDVRKEIARWRRPITRCVQAPCRRPWWRTRSRRAPAGGPGRSTSSSPCSCFTCSRSMVR